MKQINKKLSLLLATFISVGTLTGCGGKDIDETKSQLNVAVYNGGGGTAWMNAIADEFEKRYAGVSLEEGKMGVEVWVTAGKDQFVDATLLGNMPSAAFDVYFTEQILYSKALSQNAFLDITELLNEKYDMVDFGDGEKQYSIMDKMTDADKTYFAVNENGSTKYYALSFMSYHHGIVYDVDLFNQYGFYFDANDMLGAVKDNGDVLSAGPDEEVGTFDDGLPATWNQMNELIVYMRDMEVTPFTWSGQHNYPRNHLFDTVWANYEGANDYMLNFSMNGTGTVGGEEVTITPATGYKIASQEGKLAALTAARDIVSNNKNYSNQAFLSSQSHLGAQREYLLSRYMGKPIAMLLEATYWENEAIAYFEEMEAYGEEWSQDIRRFGYMPIPRFIGTEGVPDQENNELIVNSTCSAYAFINAHTKHVDVAKEFFKFAYSNEMLSKAAGLTGLNRGVNYVLTDEDKANLSYYQMQATEIEKTHTAVNKGLPPNKTFAYGAQDCMKYWDRTVYANGVVYSDVFKSFADNLANGKPLSPRTLWQSYAININESTWSIK